MSTPDAISVESVREKRAIATLRTTEPICIGIRSLKLSHLARPLSVRFQRLKKQNPPTSRRRDEDDTGDRNPREPRVPQPVRHVHDDLRQLRQLPAELIEDLDEHRHEEHQ